MPFEQPPNTGKTSPIETEDQPHSAETYIQVGDVTLQVPSKATDRHQESLEQTSPGESVPAPIPPLRSDDSNPGAGMQNVPQNRRATQDGERPLEG
jgi:hypothetical protein